LALANKGLDFAFSQLELAINAFATILSGEVDEICEFLDMQNEDNDDAGEDESGNKFMSRMHECNTSTRFLLLFVHHLISFDIT
jgi:hypothetical protein